MTDKEIQNSKKLKSVKSFLPFLKPYKKQLLVAAISLVLAASATLVVPLCFRKIVDLGFSDISHAQINITFINLFLAAFVLAFASALRYYIVSWLGERVTSDIRKAVYSHIIVQSPEFFETKQSGELLSRINNDTSIVQILVGTSVSMAVRNLFLLVGGMTMMFITSIKLSLIILATLLLTVLPIMLMGKKVRLLSRNSQDKIALASAIAGEKINAILTVQSFANEQKEIKIFNQSIETSFIASINRSAARGRLTFVAILLGFTSIIAVLWLGAYAVSNKEMSGGQLTQFFLYAVIVAGAIAALSEVLGDVQRAIGASERLLELLSFRSQVQNPKEPFISDRAMNQAISIDIQDINFHYPSIPSNVLTDVSLHIKAGEKIAIVGPSGSGKTSLFKLIQRFYDPQSGSISFDGVDIKQFQLADLRQLIGVVPQEISIFSENALENIRYGKEHASDEEVIQASKLASVDEFITRLPDGYQTYLGDRGVRLSGGQKQRIAIARALLKDPPILLLDEATSSLDAESERLVQQALEVAMKGRTTIVIAHRLATVKKADRIVVIENGRIVEIGDHASLVNNEGLYSHLAKLQFTDA
ncbi:ATP-binding cassette domain-containing protein [Polynucleobacter sp. 15G-AUS-farblos]|uniref:ABC transporter transmembrane domain-containing protein n=1 Tax=Polynucleobacter sp. 15G-AUS-farblos TaxID=2689094 RepID=UPI001C0D8A03|nr:ABC transporter transmembrane domain-containing protein [Polynucleobacter sp. 15G-AUS-farblos]MBU3582995.1 ATP-binding cassette domain-containing protein [Polynucleobacter sp. 15G-AUS-farblos]